MSGKNGSVFRLKGNAPHPGPSGERQPELRTILGAGCSVEGRLVCSGPTRLDGDVSGELLADDILMIDKNASVVADLDVQELMVLGKVTGNITASKRVMLAASACVEGDIDTPSITIKDGAQVSGKVAVVRPGAEDEAAAAGIETVSDHEADNVEPLHRAEESA